MNETDSIVLRTVIVNRGIRELLLTLMSY